ncbi:SGNH/GDSL hydrolase family protein [Dermabacteraceae bacterium P13115]
MSENRTHLFIGDSITDCEWRQDPEQIGYGYVRLVAEHFAAHEPGSTVINRGTSGDRVRDLRARFNDDCIAHDPDLVTIYVGVNDTWYAVRDGEETTPEQFEADYRFLLDQLSARWPARPVIMVVPFVTVVNDETARFGPDLAGKQEVVRELAKEFGHTLIELPEVMEKAQEAGHTPDSLAADGVHPTAAGHKLLADAWLAAREGVTYAEED